MSFKRIKQLLTSDAVVTHFDRTKKTKVVTDASAWDLSAILTVLRNLLEKRIEELLHTRADCCLQLNAGTYKPRENFLQ